MNTEFTGPATESEKSALAWIISLQEEAYNRGYKDAEEYYTNDCFECGYAGEWSTWVCDSCKKNMGEDYELIMGKELEESETTTELEETMKENN